MCDEERANEPEGTTTPASDRVLIPGMTGISMRGICTAFHAPPLGPLVVGFRKNLESIIWVLTLPYAVASAGASEGRYRQLLASERIKAEFLKPGFDDEAARNREAHRCAAELLKSEEENAKVRADAIGCLEWLLATDGLATGTVELLRQALVLAWSAFEVLTTELFRLLLNSHPALVQKLVDDERTRRLFQLKAIPLEVLLSNNFDVSQQMGDILIALHPVDSPVSAKIVFDTLLPFPPQSLDAKELRLLNQQRHLILHRRCIIDFAYVKATGSTLPVGSELTVNTAEVAAAIQIVHDCGLDLISAVREQL